jgi:hypothetical protein
MLTQGGAAASKVNKRKVGAAEEEPEVVEVEVEEQLPAEEPVIMDGLEPCEAAAAVEPAPGVGHATGGRIMSGNAYMLVYRRQGLQRSPPSEPVQLPPK